MGSAPSPPPTPDPKVLADQQMKINQSAQRGSMVDQSNPYGTTSYKQTGVGPDGTPTYTASTQLSDTQQKLFDTLQGTQGTAGGLANSILSQTPTGRPDFSADAGGLTAKLLGQYTSYLNPQFDYQTNQLDAKLRNQGINPSSPAYKQQMMDLQDNQNRNVSQFLATTEPQAYQQAVSNYQTPLDIASKLAAFGAPGSVTSANLNTSGNTVAPASMTAAQSASNDAYKNQLAASQANTSGLTSLLGGGASVLGGIMGGPPGALVGSAIGSGLSSIFGGLGPSSNYSGGKS